MIVKNKSKLTRQGILFLIPLLIYGATLTFDYALDDALYISDNDFTKQGLNGIWNHLSNESLVGFYGEQKNLLTGGRYRPLAPITYSIEYAIYGFQPGISHLINILLYGLLLTLFYRILEHFSSPKQWFFNWAFFAVLIFAVHPLHVEVVANIKGRDQILGLIAVFGTTLLSFNCFEKKNYHLLLIGGLFFLGLLAKENTITFLPIIPLLHYFFGKKDLKQLLPLFMALLIPSILWFAMRSWAIQGFESVESTTLLNDPFLTSTPGQKLGTKFYTWLLYLKLLIVPFPLTYDYYPFHIPIRGFANIWTILSVIIHVAIMAIAFIGFRKRTLLAFLIILYAATFSISSNLFFNIGAFMNERFMFEPSLAFSLLLGLVLFRKVSIKFQRPLAISILIIFAIISFSRTFAWKDNYTLFTTDVNTSKNSIKSLMASGGIMTERAARLTNVTEKNELLQQAITYLTKATELLPTELNNYRLLGNAYLEKDGVNTNTMNAYLEVFRQSPGDSFTIKNIEYVIANKEYDPSSRLNFGLKFVGFMQSSGLFNYHMGLIYGRDLGDLDNAVNYLKSAVELEPSNTVYLEDLGAALAISGDYLESIDYMKRILIINPNDKKTLSTIGLNYQNLGMNDLAQEYFNRANQ